MDAIWERIEKWFAKNSPDTAFNKVSTESELQKLELEIGLLFPNCLRESYKIHNGMEEGAFFGNRHLMTLSEIAYWWKFWTDSLAKGGLASWKVNPKGPIEPVRWS